MLKAFRIALMVCIVAISGCARPFTVMPNGAPGISNKYPPDSVKIFFNTPPVSYKPIAIFSWDYIEKRMFKMANISDALPEIKKKASEVGANAVILNTPEVKTFNAAWLDLTGEFIEIEPEQFSKLP